MPVKIDIQVADTVAAKLRLQNPDLSRLGLEMLVGSLYRDGQLSKVEAMHELGIPDRLAFEAFLARHRLDREWAEADIDAEFATLDKLGQGR